MVIAKSADPNIEALFGDESRVAVARSAELLKQIQDLLDAPEENAMLASVGEGREAYMRARDAVYRAKHEQKTEDTDRLFESQFRPAMVAYLSTQQKLLQYERTSIGAQADSIQAARRAARWSLLAGGLAALSIGVLIAWSLGRSIIRPLRRAMDHARAIEAKDLTAEIRSSGATKRTDAKAPPPDGMSRRLFSIRRVSCKQLKSLTCSGELKS